MKIAPLSICLISSIVVCSIVMGNSAAPHDTQDPKKLDPNREYLQLDLSEIGNLNPCDRLRIEKLRKIIATLDFRQNRKFSFPYSVSRMLETQGIESDLNRVAIRDGHPNWKNPGISVGPIWPHGHFGPIEKAGSTKFHYYLGYKKNTQDDVSKISLPVSEVWLDIRETPQHFVPSIKQTEDYSPTIWQLIQNQLPQHCPENDSVLDKESVNFAKMNRVWERKYETDGDNIRTERAIVFKVTRK